MTRRSDISSLRPAPLPPKLRGKPTASLDRVIVCACCVYLHSGYTKAQTRGHMHARAQHTHLQTSETHPTVSEVCHILGHPSATPEKRRNQARGLPSNAARGSKMHIHRTDSSVPASVWLLCRPCFCVTALPVGPSWFSKQALTARISCIGYEVVEPGSTVCEDCGSWQAQHCLR